MFLKHSSLWSEPFDWPIFHWAISTSHFKTTLMKHTKHKLDIISKACWIHGNLFCLKNSQVANSAQLHGLSPVIWDNPRRENKPSQDAKRTIEHQTFTVFVLANSIVINKPKIESRVGLYLKKRQWADRLPNLESKKKNCWNSFCLTKGYQILRTGDTTNFWSRLRSEMRPRRGRGLETGSRRYFFQRKVLRD